MAIQGAGLGHYNDYWIFGHLFVIDPLTVILSGLAILAMICLFIKKS